MGMREKLIELLRAVQYQGNAIHGYHDKYIQNSELADHLIANDVVPVVRCKDCKHYKTIQCSCSCTVVSSEWYCADGERKDNG